MRVKPVIKLNYNLLKLFILISTLLMLSACGGGNHIVPIKKGVKGNSKVVSVTVTASPHIKSPQLVRKIKAAVEMEARKRLKGNHSVKLNINITNWQPAWDFNGAKTMHQKSRLNTIVSVIDAKTGAVIGKYDSGAFYHKDTKETNTNINVNTHLINTSAYFMVYELE